MEKFDSIIQISLFGFSNPRIIFLGIIHLLTYSSTIKGEGV